MALDGEATRKRRAHTKSRQGCGNCKLRRVKCDEAKPKCQKCTAFGVACDYESKSTQLQGFGVNSFQIKVPGKPLTPPATPGKEMDRFIDDMMNTPLQLHSAGDSDVCYIDKPHLDLLKKFYNRSVLTIGTAESVSVYQEVLTRNAAEHSFCLHAVLRFTLMHDRYIYDPPTTKASTAESFHGYHAVAIFGDKLRAPLHENEKDAMWATAAIIGASSIAEYDATSAQEAWPLKESHFTDLDWMKLSEGKKEVFKLADPLRETSAFKPAIESERNKKMSIALKSPSTPELDNLIPCFTKLYNLDSPTSIGHPKEVYHDAASIVERLLPLECNHSTVVWFISFLGHMNVEFRQAAGEKDPWAIILLALWYAKMLPYGVWWIVRRAWFECQAICIYLDNNLPADHEVRQLLEFPKSVCGLGRSGVEEPLPWRRNF